MRRRFPGWKEAPADELPSHPFPHRDPVLQGQRSRWDDKGSIGRNGREAHFWRLPTLKSSTPSGTIP